MQKSGFTLIELLVVIAIIGMLSSIVFASLNTARQKGRDAKRVSELRQIKTALELYFDKNDAYPGVFNTYYWIDDNNYSESLPCSMMTGGLKPYLPVCTMLDPQGKHYAYALKSDGSYKVGTTFELSNNQGVPFVWGSSNTSVTGWFEPK